MRYELKSVGIWAFTKVSFFVNLPIGFMFGLLYAVMLPLMIGMSEFGGFPGPAMDTSDFPFGVMLVVLPILGAMFAAVFHTIGGVVLLAIYNLIVRWVGGLEFELDPVKVELSTMPLHPSATQRGVGEASVAVPPVYKTGTPSGSPPPPPAVSGVAPTVPPTPAPAFLEPSVSPVPATPAELEPEGPATIVPELPPKPPAGTTETSGPPAPPTAAEKNPDDKPENGPPPAPGIS